MSRVTALGMTVFSLQEMPGFAPVVGPIEIINMVTHALTTQPDWLSGYCYIQHWDPSQPWPQARPQPAPAPARPSQTQPQPYPTRGYFKIFKMSKSHVSIFKCHQKVMGSIPAASLSFPTVTGLSIVILLRPFPMWSLREAVASPLAQLDGRAVLKEKSNQIAVKKIENSHIPKRAATYLVKSSQILVKAATFWLKQPHSG
ncbi:hypothetical protein B0H10DRAFT_1965411 [Mycena sp. CBHHK59/15]|nr:hypothetical protein B0H10DRAFT_1965411 [Mycena sp. CBHHK59/15]